MFWITAIQAESARFLKEIARLERENFELIKELDLEKTKKIDTKARLKIEEKINKKNQKKSKFYKKPDSF